MNLTYLDWLIILAYVLLIFYAGSYAKRYVGKISDFLVADRSMGFHLGLVSLMSTEIGIIPYMYLAEADHPNVQFNYYRPGIGNCEIDMH